MGSAKGNLIARRIEEGICSEGERTGKRRDGRSREE